MIAYLDASVVLRLVLGEPGRLKEWQRIDRAVASALTEVECLRTLDRLRVAGAVTVDELANRRAAVYRLLEAVEVVDIARTVLRRASEPSPTPLGTLDAIHLATALLWRDSRDAALTMATHDRALATAARAAGLEVVGAPRSSTSGR
ncbi:MAG TPA: PIN domain-containing protein [Gemmatimonadaceae bacterium]|nr:PIN domain-containing protein [Gemmatimonadaceae bacterium]